MSSEQGLEKSSSEKLVLQFEDVFSLPDVNRFSLTETLENANQKLFVCRRRHLLLARAFPSLFNTNFRDYTYILPVYAKPCTGSVRIHVGTLTDFFSGLDKEIVDCLAGKGTISPYGVQGVSISNSVYFRKLQVQRIIGRRGCKLRKIFPRNQNASFSLLLPVPE